MENEKIFLFFKDQYEHRTKVRKINENSWFGIILGVILSVVAGYQSLCVVGILSVVFNILVVIGLLLVVSGGFFPRALSNPVRLIRKACSALGNIILKILLIPVYVLMTLVNMILHKSYSEKFGFSRWKKSEKEKSSFYDYKELTHKNGRFVTVEIINNILDFFVANKIFVVIPIVILLLIMGMIVFFASSNAVFSFVYTLF